MKAASFLRPAALAWALALAGAAVAWRSPERAVSAIGVAGAYASACVGIVAAHRRRARASRASPETAAPAGDAILVAYASQTGLSEELAGRTHALLEAAGRPARIAPLDALRADDLAAHACALFVVSTTGEGDPPDHATPFLRRAMRADARADVPLSSLRYGVLALGDRRYARYCAFGRQLDAWLAEQGAQPMFETIDVDNGDAGALHRWQARLESLFDATAATALAADAPPGDSVWTLETRRLLNPGSAGWPAFHLGLLPREGSPLAWQAGDIAEIVPRHPRGTVQRWLDAHALDGEAVVHCDGTPTTLADALATRCLPAGLAPRHETRPARPPSPQALIDELAPLARRSYTIASLPDDGRLELLVRQVRVAGVERGSPPCSLADAPASDGARPGLASGWLTEHVAQGGAVTLRVRSNRGFHAPADDRPVILIGNGTGLAGLRAHLKARVRAGRRRNWLIFGERSSTHDAFYREELDQWLADGRVERIDRVWSREAAERRYVQDVLRASAASVAGWIGDGASLYVCGSFNGMAPDVHQALLDILGQTTLDALTREGRYRRDVY